jgi:lysozyme
MIDIRELIKRHEGKRLKPYMCSKFHKTVGYGWNMDTNPLPPEMASYLSLHGEITDDMAEQLLTISINNAVHNCLDLFPDFVSYSDNRKAALLDWVFNVGAGKAQQFKKAMAAIHTGDWDKAADEMTDSAWFKQVGNRAVEIVKMIREG